MAVFSKIFPSLATSYIVQAAFALAFVPQRNEKYYDLGGAVGFISTTFASLYYPSLRESVIRGKILPLPPLSHFAPRQLILSAALGIWITRLGSFLVQAFKAGGDSRFDEVKHKPVHFTFYWFMQATWVFIVGLPVYLANTIPKNVHPPLNTRDYLSIGLFASSFFFEALADRQKTIWRRSRDAKEHDEKFITSGLWSISRHPNYVGEVGIWAGIWGLSTTALQTPYFPRGTVAIAAISPIFTYFLLRKLSGVPPLEKAGDKRFGTDPKWHEYKRTVPIFWPWSSARE
ncbi:MAG: hypothetical protein NXY57DRAFT_1017777 [Lentinula lateritia]|uniref:DUF1295-domain-containing protein n=1 Tax=Lentinula lateritia TaxID=40482 RepID=A0ABQ8V7J0_9AGAR|nr:MAG: hypothetical protein NXY57DRAFT_1017777 [Lentinula lateritia]KAJ4478567.1 hypothetical protein C8R41DRAFT_844333 [Lentinula lateritia]